MLPTDPLDELLSPSLADRLQSASPAALSASLPPGARADSLLNDLTQLGGTYDKGARARPNPNVQLLTRQELEVLYVLNHWAQRAVNQLPLNATRRGWEVEDESEETRLLESEERRLQIRARFREADLSARLYRRAAILIVTPERGADLRQPLSPDYAGGITNLVVLDDAEINPSTWDGDPASPTYRQPETWFVTPYSAAATSTLSGGTVVHASRLIVLHGGVWPEVLLRDRSWQGYSVLQTAWDAIRNKTSVGQSGAVIAQELSESVFKIRGLMDTATGAQASGLASRLKSTLRAKGVLGALFLDAEDSYEVAGRSATGYVDIDEGAARDLCAALNMPAVLLFGEAPAGFNTDGESWRRKWAGQVLDHQELVYRPGLERIYQLLLNASPERPERWRLEFLPVEQPTEAEEAAHRKVIADTDAIYLDRGVLSPEHVARSRFSEAGWSDTILPVEPDETAEELALAAKELVGGAAGVAEKASDVALNGAQISSALSICQQVAARQLPRESGVTMLVEFFSLLPERAERIMGPIGRAFFIETLPQMDSADPSALAPWVRLDAEISPEGVCLLLPLTGEALRQWERVRDQVRALLPDLPPPPGRPHVTVLYLGSAPAESLGEISTAAAETVRLQSPVPFYAHRVHAFTPSPSSDGETPVIVEVGWGFEALHVALLQRLAPWVQVQQFSPYRAHATLGYLPRPLTDAERADLAALVIEPSEGPPPRLSRVDLCRGEEVIAVLPLAAVGEEL